MSHKVHTPSTLPQPPGDAQRLVKVVAAPVPCLRRETALYIAEHWVRVDGQCVDTGLRVCLDQGLLRKRRRLRPGSGITFPRVSGFRP